MNEMPTMPTLEENTTSPDENKMLESGDETISKDVVPKQSYDTIESKVVSNVSVPKIPKTGIAVIATRKGFYGQQRLKEGDKFVVRKIQDLGEWMKCIEPSMERERLNYFKDKKAKK